MKRMSLKSPGSNSSYKVLTTDDNDEPLTVTKQHTKKKWLICRVYGRKSYILLILTSVVLIWILIYYKLLNHRFELPEPLRNLRKMFGDGEVKKRHGREEETENITPSSKKPCLPQFQTERNENVIHFAIVACNERYEDAIVSMKSICLVTNHHVHFHIFTDNEHIKTQTFDKELKTWPGWIEHWMMFTVHPISYPVDDKINWISIFKQCASQRLFLPNILADVDALIYIDTDTLFLEAPEHLWNYFSSFDKHHIAGMVNECENVTNCWYNKKLHHPYFEPYGVNSGVMLMNLTRMRKLAIEIPFREIYLKYGPSMAYGDQDILNIYFQSNREKLFNILCQWNYRPDHCMFGNVCTKAATDGVSLLHGNRQVFKKRNLQPEFFYIYDMFLKHRFEDDFPAVVVNSILDVFESEKLKTSPCGKMLNALLKHITCVNN